MNLPEDIGNAEGYCKKCRQPLGIEGVCYFCALQNDDTWQHMLDRVFKCPISGQSKVHHRLYVYQCPNPEHWNKSEMTLTDQQASDVVTGLQTIIEMSRQAGDRRESMYAEGVHAVADIAEWILEEVIGSGDDKRQDG